MIWRYRRLSMIWRCHFVQSVPVCISPVAVHAWASPRARDEVSPVDQGMTEVDVGRGRPGSRAAYGRPSQPSCQPPRRGLGPYSCVSLPLGGSSGRSRNETWEGCIASLTNEGSSSHSASITLHAWVAVPTHHFPTRELAPATPTRHLISPLLPR
jgi:hypothetical protein